MIPSIHGVLNKPRIAGGAFAPSDITGYEWHFIGDSLGGEGYVDGNTISSGWASEVNSYDLTTINGTPTYETNEVNGHDIARFLAADTERLRDLSANIAVSTKFTYIAVFLTPSTATQVFLYRPSGDWYILKRTDDDMVFFCRNTNNGGTTTLSTGDINTATTPGNWMILIWTVDFDNGSMEVYINNALEGSDSQAGSSFGPGTFDIDFWTSTSYADMDLAEAIFYDGHVVDSSERGQLFTYLNNKYSAY